MEETVLRQPSCPDVKGYVGTSRFTAFWGDYLGMGVHRSRFPNAFEQTSNSLFLLLLIRNQGFLLLRGLRKSKVCTG